MSISLRLTVLIVPVDPQRYPRALSWLWALPNSPQLLSSNLSLMRRKIGPAAGEALLPKI